MSGMPTLRIALAQVNSTVGDIAGNAAAVRRWSRLAADAGAQLVAFPEMMLTGYPIEDLVFRDSVVSSSLSALAQLALDLFHALFGTLEAERAAQLFRLASREIGGSHGHS